MKVTLSKLRKRNSWQAQRREIRSVYRQVNSQFRLNAEASGGLISDAPIRSIPSTWFRIHRLHRFISNSLRSFFFPPPPRSLVTSFSTFFLSSTFDEKLSTGCLGGQAGCDGTFVEWPVHTRRCSGLIDSRAPAPITHGSVINCTLGRVHVFSVGSEIARPWRRVFVGSSLRKVRVSCDRSRVA